jgi:hypothetical protein
MLEKHPLKIAVNKTGDHLITQGPAQPVFFISAGKQLAEFLTNPANAVVTAITGVGSAAVLACLAAGAEFTEVQAKPAAIKFHVPNGLIVIFVDEHQEIDDDTWHIIHNGDVVVTPYQVTLRSAAACHQMHFPALPAGSLAPGGHATPLESAHHDSVKAALAAWKKQQATKAKTAFGLHNYHANS